MEHHSARGTVRQFTFASLPVDVGLQQSLAAVFAERCRPGQGWDSHDVAATNFRAIRAFAQFVALQDQPVQDLDALTPGLWSAWRLSRPNIPAGQQQLRCMVHLLRHHPRIPAAVREVMPQRLPRLEVQETALRPAEFEVLKKTARQLFRAAHLRISENAAHLDAWRAGAFAPGSRDAKVGEALDVLARTGYAPGYRAATGRQRVTWRYKEALGGESAPYTWHRLFLTSKEASALGMLLVIEHGLNATAIAEMPVPKATPDPGENGSPVYRVELHKPRRGAGRHVETRNWVDTDARSPGRLITQALEATSFSRAYVREHAPDVDRLLIWRNALPSHPRGDLQRVGPFSIGLAKGAVNAWAQEAGLKGSLLRRTRKTVNVLHRRESGQNSQDTHDRTYVIPEPQVHQAAVPVIADGAQDALDRARRTVLQAQLTQHPEPGDQPTATADCHDYTHSPFNGHGISCQASFLMCTACPNARIHPGHHPRLALLHQALANLRDLLDTTEWETTWGDAHARLDNLKDRLGPAQWQRALAAATPRDREMITLLLDGDLNS